MRIALKIIPIAFMAGLLLIRCSTIVEPPAVPPVLTAMADTSISINDSITVTASAINGTSVGKYVWAKDGIAYADTTITGSIKVVYADSGRKVIRVKAIDAAGLVSEPDSCIIVVLLSPPVVTAMPDTSMDISSSIIVTALAVDNGTVKKYVWAKDSSAYSDTTAMGSLKVIYADTGRKIIRVKAIDDDGIVSKPDSCIIMVRVSSLVEPVPHSEIQNVHASYTTAGNTIMMEFQDSTYTHPACNGSVLDTVTDTIVMHTYDTLIYVVSGDTMLLENQVDSASTRYADPAAVVHKYERFLRQGTGTGLEGDWKYEGLCYIVTAGQLTPAEIIRLDAAVIENKFWIFNSNNVTFTFTPTAMTIATVINWAEIFVFYWSNNPYYYPNSELYDITVIQENINKVRLVGNISPEVVTVLYDSMGNWTYKSSEFLHQTYTYYAAPSTCPNNFEPPWYRDFLNANAFGGAAKVRLLNNREINNSQPWRVVYPARLKESW